MTGLDGRKAVVTGAASGIGRASAALFAERGAQVLAVDIAEAFERSPGAPDHPSLRRLALDVTEADAPERIVTEAQISLGGLDILFANAGVSARHPVEDTTDAVWDRVMDVNLRAAFRLTRAAVPKLKASPAGRIVVTASVMAESADYGLVAYCASKAGLLGLVRTLALELGRDGVTANAILPGAIVTGMTAGLEGSEAGEVWTRKAALKRLGRPEDVARAAAFLASDDAGFITGQAIAVDGGLTLRA